MLRRRLIIIFLIFSLIGSACWGGVFLRSRYVVPILMYHSINPNKNPWIRSLMVHPDDFQRQMKFLRDHHYNVIPLGELAAMISQEKKIPPRTVAITFDDGYKDNYTYGFPVLKKYQLPATIFIITSEVGRPPAEKSEDDRLSWDEIKAMQRSGLIEFGSHGVGPEPLVNINSREQMRREIFDSKKILEERLGREVLLFSYPEGRFNRYSRKLVAEAGYKFAVATLPGRGYPNYDIFALKRMKISPRCRNLFLFWVQVSGYYTYFKERKKQLRKYLL